MSTHTGQGEGCQTDTFTYFAASPNYTCLYFQETFPMSGGENDNLCRERYGTVSDKNKRHCNKGVPEFLEKSKYKFHGSGTKISLQEWERS